MLVHDIVLFCIQDTPSSTLGEKKTCLFEQSVFSRPQVPPKINLKLHSIILQFYYSIHFFNFQTHNFDYENNIISHFLPAFSQPRSVDNTHLILLYFVCGFNTKQHSLQLQNICRIHIV